MLSISVLGQSAHQKLVKDLLNGYDRVTPPGNQGNATMIKFGVNINKIQRVVSNSWFKIITA